MTDATLARTNTARSRLSRDRPSIEFVLEALLRPGNWAARLSYSLGLQGRVRVNTIALETGAASAAGAPQRPLRLAFASDFHAGGMTDRRTLKEACDALAALQPDVLLLGGDFVSVRGADIDRIAPLLASIPAPLGKYAVLGNHDLHADHSRIEARLEREGITLLTNRNVRLPAPFDRIVICGLDDTIEGVPRADLALDGADGTRIVLMHSPDGLDAIGDREFALALCGHTHGGQVALPWGIPLIVPQGRLSRRYCRGRYDLTGTSPRALVVSHGIGCSALPVRMFASPEVHLCLIS